MLKFKKLILASISALILLFGLSVPSTMAQGINYQGTWYNQGPAQWYTKTYDQTNPQEIFGERYTAAQVQWIVYSLFSISLHSFVTPDVVICYLTSDALGSCTQSAQDVLKAVFPVDAPPIASSSVNSNSASGSFFNTFSSFMLADRPLSGISYIKNVGSNLHLIPEAQAQAGFGFGALNFVQGLWGGARNVMYALMILIIIGMAFMIMFRVKLSPQTVISVQSSLPKIIITLILITFSYAIAGFMVDIMYVLIGLISVAFTQSNVFSADAATLFSQMTDGNLGWGILGVFILYWFRFLFAVIALTMGATGLISGPLLFVGSMLIVPLSVIVMSIFLTVITFKVIVMLIKNFVNVVLLVIASPFIIGFGALPVGGGGFGSWFRNLASRLAVYPIVGVLLQVAFVFLAAAYNLGGLTILPADWLSDGLGNWMFGVNPTLFSGAVPWAPPLTMGVGANSVRFMFLFASLGVIAIIPKTVEVIQSMMAGKPFAYGTAIGEGFGPVTGIGKAGAIGGVTYGENQILGGASRWATGGRSEIVKQGASALRKAFGARG